jgi:hypothetical protein
MEKLKYEILSVEAAQNRIRFVLILRERVLKLSSESVVRVVVKMIVVEVREVKMRNSDSQPTSWRTNLNY